MTFLQFKCVVLNKTVWAQALASKYLSYADYTKIGKEPGQL